MKSSEEIMEILEAYDLTGGFARRRPRWPGVITRPSRTMSALRDAGQRAGSSVRSGRW